MLLRWEQATQTRTEVGHLPGLSRPERPVYRRQTRRAASVSRLRRRGRGWCALACGASAGFATPRRALPEHLRAVAPSHQDRVQARRAARSKSLPGRQPPLAHARFAILCGQAVGKQRHDLSSSEEQRLDRARGYGWEALASLAEEACRTPLPLV